MSPLEADSSPSLPADPLARLLLIREVEEFLYTEAETLDQHRYDDWLTMITEDIRYFMPLRRNVSHRDLDRMNSREQVDVAWFDEDHFTLLQRVLQIKTGVHWSEEPFSRTTHMVSNVQLVHVAESEVSVSCKILVYRNRLETETDLLVGKRRDTLRRVDGRFKLSRREILIDQNVLTIKNLTTLL